MLQWTTSYNSHMLSVSPGVFEADGHIVFFDTEDGHTLGTFGPVSKMGGMSGGKVMVYRDEHKEVSVIKLFRHSRLKAINLMQAAWDTHKGKPETSHLPQHPVTNSLLAPVLQGERLRH